MRTELSLHPVCMGLLRELVEAHEAMTTSTNLFFDDSLPLYKSDGAYNEKSLIEERWVRDEAYDNLATEFCAHLLIMGSPHVDIRELKSLWSSSMTRLEEDRAHGKLWDATWAVSRAYIDLYTAK